MVMIAFDEMCTCHAYAADKNFYAGLGSNRFVRWLREVIADEAVHSMNAVNVIRARYSDRVREVGAILDGLAGRIFDEFGLWRHLRSGLLRGEVHKADANQLPRQNTEKCCEAAHGRKATRTEHVGRVDINAAGDSGAERPACSFGSYMRRPRSGATRSNERGRFRCRWIDPCAVSDFHIAEFNIPKIPPELGSATVGL